MSVGSGSSNHLPNGCMKHSSTSVCRHMSLLLLWGVAFSAIAMIYLEDTSWIKFSTIRQVDDGDNPSVDEFVRNGTCPLDAMIHKDCQFRQKCTVCIYPDFVLKKVKHQHEWENEVRMFQVLNDTRYFPRLMYHSDEECMTMLIENVRPRGKDDRNEFSKSLGYYKKFFKGAFKIFNANHIYPLDLNVCCNTVVNGNDIRIIDFDLYQEVTNTSKLAKMNNDLLSQLLQDVKEMSPKNSPKQNAREKMKKKERTQNKQET